jgi:hypothetical protein
MWKQWPKQLTNQATKNLRAQNCTECKCIFLGLYSYPCILLGHDVVIYGLQLKMAICFSGEKNIGCVPSQCELRIPKRALYRASKRGEAWYSVISAG